VRRSVDSALGIAIEGRTPVAKTFWIISDRIGEGDEDLGRLLMHNFLYSLARGETKPARLMFMNGGVKLVCTGSGELDDIKLLADSGVVVKVCGTCLDFFGLKDALAVGEIGDMPGSAAFLAGDSDVVTIA
jgi:selenium metabolism protein YedF